MNLGGVKVSSVELERAVLEGVGVGTAGAEGGGEGVAEVAAVGVPSPGGGPEQLYLFLVLAAAPQGGSGRCNNGEGGAGEQQQQPVQGPSLLTQRCQAAIRMRLNPLFKVERVVLRAALPRTATNKVMRRVLRDEVLLQRAAKL